MVSDRLIRTHRFRPVSSFRPLDTRGHDRLTWLSSLMFYLAAMFIRTGVRRQVRSRGRQAPLTYSVYRTCCTLQWCVCTCIPRQVFCGGRHPCFIVSYLLYLTLMCVAGTPDFVLSYLFSLAAACVYKGTVHYAGEKWDDGCDYTCECLSTDPSVYSCTSK